MLCRVSLRASYLFSVGFSFLLLRASLFYFFVRSLLYLLGSLDLSFGGCYPHPSHVSVTAPQVYIALIVF